MSNKVKRLAKEFVEAARRRPEIAPAILRKGAATFAALASDPQNAHAVRQLTAIGLDFAGAAAQVQERAATTNDFTQLLRESAQAWEELGPDAAFSMHAAQDVQALAREVHESELPGQYVSIQPHTFLNKDATLGRSAMITYNPTEEQKTQGIQQMQTVAFWQGSKTESQAMTVDFGNTLPPVSPSSPKAPSTVSARPFAIVQYGADGNTQNSVIVDIGLGRRATVVGNYISVLVGMDPPPVGQTAAVPVLTLGASIGTFTAHSIAPITRTVYIDNLAAATVSEFFVIPQRAVQLLPPFAASPTDTLEVFFGAYNGVTVAEWRCVYSPNTPFLSPIPVPADAYFVRVRSAQGVAFPSVGIKLPFELSL